VIVVERDPPVITAYLPAQLTAHVGDTVALAVSASSCGRVFFQWCFGPDALPGETSATLTLTNVQPAQSGVYTVKVFTSAGTQTASTELRVNLPPVAHAAFAPLLVLFPTQTNLLILSLNGSNAAVVLDGSLSTDPENDPLQYLWLADGSLMPFADGVLVTNVLPVGPHAVTLVVFDGADHGLDTILFEIITAGRAVDELLALVDEANLSRKDKRPLLDTLKAARKAFADGKYKHGLDELGAFQKKVHKEIGRTDPALAQDLIDAAQSIIEAFGGR
jgi:hypothetical protein